MFKPEIGKEYTLQKGEYDTTHYFVPGSKVKVQDTVDGVYYWCSGTSKTHGEEIEQIVHVSCLGVE